VKQLNEANKWAAYLKAGLQAHAQGDFEEAEGLLQAALEEAEPLGFGDDKLSTTLAYYGANALAKGDMEHAQMIMEESLEALSEVENKSENIELNRATFLNNLGLIYKGQKYFGKAEESYQRALIILERFKDRGDPIISTTKSNIAVLFMLQENYGAAELLLLDALQDEVQGNQGKHHVPTSLNQLAAAYMGQEKFDKAETLFKHCLDSWEAHGWPEHKVAGSIVENYCDLLRSQGRDEEFAQLQTRIKDMQA
jgi:tetratricopeptide (TPR) repeat protein